MASTSAEVLRLVHAGGRPSEAQIESLRSESPVHLFGDLVEPLADSFSPDMVAAYVEIFGRLLEKLLPAAGRLRERYLDLRGSRPSFEPRRVVVLSRVTLGADVAITSTLLAAAKLRWPRAEIVFAGTAKNRELFGGIPWLEAPYQRAGTLEERVRSGLRLAPLVADPQTLVIDPDSRLSQLGLLPLADVDRTLFFESRTAGGEEDSLVQLASRFSEETLGVAAAPWLAPPSSAGTFDVTVSFGVGENNAKRVGDGFETALISGLLQRGQRVLLDAGAPDTAEWNRAAELETLGVSVWRGSFVAFAGAIRDSRLYVGYDSAGQHVAAAFGVPRITVFAGYPNERFLARWRPDGAGRSTVLVNEPGLMDKLWASI